MPSLCMTNPNKLSKLGMTYKAQRENLHHGSQVVKQDFLHKKSFIGSENIFQIDSLTLGKGDIQHDI